MLWSKWTPNPCCIWLTSRATDFSSQLSTWAMFNWQLMCCLQLRCQGPLGKTCSRARAKNGSGFVQFVQSSFMVWSLKGMLTGDQLWDLGVPLWRQIHIQLLYSRSGTLQSPKRFQDYYVYEGMRQYLWDNWNRETSSHISYAGSYGIPGCQSFTLCTWLYMRIATCCMFGEPVHYNVKFAWQALTKHA